MLILKINILHTQIKFVIVLVKQERRAGKSVGTWEPSSQKVSKVAERDLRLDIIYRFLWCQEEV